MLPGLVEVRCPACGERVDIVVDASAGAQRYVEDCAVCCRPMVIDVQVDEDGDVRVHVASEDEA